ncbi:hypothetical protein FKM82_008416 [Ascaphus truei]
MSLIVIADYELCIRILYIVDYNKGYHLAGFDLETPGFGYFPLGYGFSLSISGWRQCAAAGAGGGVLRRPRLQHTPVSFCNSPSNCSEHG